MMEPILRGIDISRWQGDFDMGRAKSEGFDFVIIKGGGGDSGLYKDSKFEQNYQKAKAENMRVGAYWFSKALTIQEAEAEADYFYNHILRGKQFDIPVYMDVENRQQLSVGKRALTNIIKAFCTKLEKYGFWVGIYSTLSYFRDSMFDQELQQYAHWVAQWASKCIYPHVEVLGMWQYGGETNFLRSNKVAGVICDQNYMYQDYPTRIREAGLNGYVKSEIPPLEFWPPRELKPEMEGHDVAVLQTLLIAHGFICDVNGLYDKNTLNGVSSFQRVYKLPITGRVDRKTWERLVDLNG